MTEIERQDLEYAKSLSKEEIEQIMRDAMFGESWGVEAADGCRVEIDGVCPHGHRSPLRVLGLV